MFKGGYLGSNNRPRYRDAVPDTDYASYPESFAEFVSDNDQKDYDLVPYRQHSERLDEVGAEVGIDPIQHFTWLKNRELQAYRLAERGRALQRAHEYLQRVAEADAVAEAMMDLDRQEGTTHRTRWIQKVREGIQNAKERGLEQADSGSSKVSKTYWRNP